VSCARSSGISLGRLGGVVTEQNREGRVSAQQMGSFGIKPLKWKKRALAVHEITKPSKPDSG
jgi:hypothetical protein